MSQARGLAAALNSNSDSIGHKVESATDALATVLEEITGSVAATSTGVVASEPDVITESVDVVEVMSAGAAALARAAWCLADHWRFFSFSAGPR